MNNHMELSVSSEMTNVVVSFQHPLYLYIQLRYKYAYDLCPPALDMSMQCYFSPLGQFWNVPIEVEEYDGDFRGSARADDYIVTVRYPGSEPRSFVGLLYSVTWEHERRPCIYAGDSQAGSSNEVDTPNDSVIEGKYTDYEVASRFATDFVYSHFEESHC